MKAPSERHLEDWIVANPEKAMLETIVGRQIKLPSGIADLLISQDDIAYIVELKKDTLNAKTLAQLLRYRHDMLKIWEMSVLVFPDECRNPTNIETRLAGILIGHSVDEDTVIAAHGAGVLTIRYEYTGDGYMFYDIYPRFIQQSVYAEYAHGHIGELARATFMNHMRSIKTSDEFEAIQLKVKPFQYLYNYFIEQDGDKS